MINKGNKSNKINKSCKLIEFFHQDNFLSLFAWVWVTCRCPLKSLIIYFTRNGYSIQWQKGSFVAVVSQTKDVSCGNNNSQQQLQKAMAFDNRPSAKMLL